MINVCLATLTCNPNLSKQNVKIIDIQTICFSLDYGISNLLFTDLGALSTSFVLIQVNTGSDAPIFNIFYPVCAKVGWHQQFTTNTVNNLLKLFHSWDLMICEYLEIVFQFKFRASNYLFLIIWLFLLFEKFCIYFWQILIALIFCLKTSKLLTASN